MYLESRAVRKFWVRYTRFLQTASIVTRAKTSYDLLLRFPTWGDTVDTIMPHECRSDDQSSIVGASIVCDNIFGPGRWQGLATAKCEKKH
jgi:hypothetical protein